MFPYVKGRKEGRKSWCGVGERERKIERDQESKKETTPERRKGKKEIENE